MTTSLSDPEVTLSPAAAAKAARIAAFDAEEARLGRIAAEMKRRRIDDEYFHSTPRFMVDHTDEQKAASKARRKAEKKEALARSFDADQCLINGCAVWELSSPQSIFGQEAKRLHQEKLAAEAEASRIAEEARKADEKKREKRRLAQRDRRQRNAAAKKLATSSEA